MALLDLMGRRWTLRILWELRDGPLRFRALQKRCDEASPTILNQRLKELKPSRVGIGSAITVGVVLPGLVWSFGNPQIDLLSGIIISSTIGVFAGGTALAQVKIAQRALKAAEGGPEELESPEEQLLPVT